MTRQQKERLFRNEILKAEASKRRLEIVIANAREALQNVQGVDRWRKYPRGSHMCRAQRFQRNAKQFYGRA